MPWKSHPAVLIDIRSLLLLVASDVSMSALQYLGWSQSLTRPEIYRE